jgi:hypothetical protein
MSRHYLRVRSRVSACLKWYRVRYRGCSQLRTDYFDCSCFRERHASGSKHQTSNAESLTKFRQPQGDPRFGECTEHYFGLHLHVVLTRGSADQSGWNKSIYLS